MEHLKFYELCFCSCRLLWSKGHLERKCIEIGPFFKYLENFTTNDNLPHKYTVLLVLEQQNWNKETNFYVDTYDELLKNYILQLLINCSKSVFGRFTTLNELFINTQCKNLKITIKTSFIYIYIYIKAVNMI
jgi:hypothetical protein